MAKKVLIIGGVAGGASCAARLRRLDENAEIVMFEKGEFISFANCGLPYHIGGVIAERDKLLLQTPESFNARFNVDVRVNNEVVAIDRENKEVKVVSHTNGKEYTESYDTLVISTGSRPIVPPISGVDSDKVKSLWNIPDMDKIIEYLDDTRATSAVVVGGGFIGVEMAENLKHAGLDVTLIEMQNQILPPIDYDMAQIAHKHMVDNDVKLLLGDGVKSFEDVSDGVVVTTNSGKKIETDLVILSIGIRPNSEIAVEAGLEVNARKGIVIDDSLKTNDDSIYAIGDVVEVTDFVSSEKAMIPLAGPANKMGRMVADNIAGMNRKYNGTQGSSVAKVFDLTVANTGQNEKQLNKAGKEINKDYKVVLIHPASHAGYYPGGLPLTLKMIYDLEGKVLGAQAVGYVGVEKRIDVLATAIRFGATVYDLEEIELCYAPPYSSAKDPVNMAGFSAENILSGTVDNITYQELPVDNAIMLDVRTPQEVSMGAVEGSINIPVDILRDNIERLDKSKPIIVYCAVGIRAYIACRILIQNGFTNVRNLAGGYTTYKVVNKNYSHSGDIGKKPNAVNSTIKEAKLTAENVEATDSIVVDACGLQCPGPIMRLYRVIEDIKNGQTINIKATDPGFFADCKAWCERTNNTFIKGEKVENYFSVWIRKGTDACNTTDPHTPGGNDKTMVVFSGDLDKALASFIIANGAASMGREVTMFFTFWGLNILRKHEPVKVKKSFIEKMFGFMMPRGTQKLTLSKMNMGGMGSWMMKLIMRKKNVQTLDELIASAKASGVHMIACTMSMDVMGIKEEELIDGIDFAGVASYLGAAEKADTNLFI